MQKYKVSIARNAKKKLERIPKEYAVKIILKIKTLEDNPRPNGSIKLAGYEVTYRIRIGVYRIVYTIESTVRIVEVRRIFHRNEGY